MINYEFYVYGIGCLVKGNATTYNHKTKRLFVWYGEEIVFTMCLRGYTVDYTGEEYNNTKEYRIKPLQG